jgi:glycosyltransferase involved in cell wall biosynthesis
VADQGVELEHLVQDAVSDDGTLDWLPHDRRVKAFVEKDAGMYDAVNRGLRRATGEILAYINCDEQYLPGALATVAEFFQQHPRVEIVFADTLIVDAEGNFLCFRKVQVPQKYHIWVSGNLPIFTAATFFRRSVIERHNLFFDPRYRDLGDADWVMRAMAQRVPMAVLRHYTSSFTETGHNMNLLPNALREKREFLQSAPLWAQKLKALFVAHHRLRRLFQGAYHQRPFSYAMYTSKSAEQRVTFQVDRPTSRWNR